LKQEAPATCSQFFRGTSFSSEETCSTNEMERDSKLNLGIPIINSELIYKGINKKINIFSKSTKTKKTSKSKQTSLINLNNPLTLAHFSNADKNNHQIFINKYENQFYAQYTNQLTDNGGQYSRINSPALIFKTNTQKQQQLINKNTNDNNNNNNAVIEYYNLDDNLKQKSTNNLMTQIRDMFNLNNFGHFQNRNDEDEEMERINDKLEEVEEREEEEDDEEADPMRNIAGKYFSLSKKLNSNGNQCRFDWFCFYSKMINNALNFTSNVLRSIALGFAVLFIIRLSM
jgi:uncharacterized glyoxalase superfamily protein PhnB